VQNENRFCVYVHRNKLTNEVFYVGSGTENRSKQPSNRSKVWNEYIKTNEFIVEILTKDLSLIDARDMEGLLIDMSAGLLNTSKPISSCIDITPEMVDNFYYDTTSPTCLRWKDDRERRGWKAGRVAGSVLFRDGNPKGCTVKLNEQRIMIHRIIYAMHHGSLDTSLVIDHIDGNPHNNNVDNLRAVTHAVNSRNTCKNKVNTSGAIGVTYKKNKSGHTYWSAIWRENNKGKSKHFMIEKYGNDEAFRLACEYRAMKIEELNKLGAGYTEEVGYHAGSWQFSPNGTLNFSTVIASPQGAADDARYESQTTYTLGKTFYIGANTPGMVALENNYSTQTNGQGIYGPALEVVMAAYQINMVKYYKE